MILAGDVGATKILLEVGEARSGRWETAFSRRYSTAEVDTFPNVLKLFLEESAGERGKGKIAAAAFGVAGPAKGNRVKMTHRPLTIDGDAIARRFPIAKARVVNDLTAVAHGIDWIPANEIETLQAGRGAAGDPRVALGVGTGLGVAYLVQDADGVHRPVPGEGGHMGFAPETLLQAELWRAVFSRAGRTPTEDVVSGRGLLNVHDFIRVRQGAAPSLLQPVTQEWITENAARGDPQCVATLDLFTECLGNVAGDHALAVMARGGVYLAGGVVGKILPALRAPRFLEAFCAKGPHSGLMMRIPVRAIGSERIGVLGAARLAAEIQ